jgi:hypothetical protein
MGEDIIGSIMVGFRFYLNKSDCNFSSTKKSRYLKDVGKM